ncbi:MAG: cell division protein FtsL [Rhodocyclaceae bacterium]|nr:cell division protein FtsL [Rhodocyclaceae bacterium]
MSRIQILLVAMVVLSALGVVSAQHESRKLVSAYEQERTRMQQLEIEWGQLQLEQGTLANPSRVERIARDELQMSVPDPASVLLLERRR